MKVVMAIIVLSMQTFAYAGDIDYERIDQKKWCVYGSKVFGPKSIIKMNEREAMCGLLEDPADKNSKIYQWFLLTN